MTFSKGMLREGHVCACIDAGEIWGLGRILRGTGVDLSLVSTSLTFYLFSRSTRSTNFLFSRFICLGKICRICIDLSLYHQHFGEF